MDEKTISKCSCCEKRKTLNKKVIEYLESLNKSHMVKIQDTEKERRVFDNDKTFKIFGIVDKGCLTPFNDYSYEWLNSFLCGVIDFIGYTDFDNFDELNDLIQDKIYEWVDNEVCVYTSDLTEWLNSHNENVYYLNDVLEENEIKDGFNLLTIAQSKAIDEVFNSALNLMIENLKQEFPEE